MNLFYASKVHNAEALLTDQEAVHCAKVLRHRIDDRILLIDGQGCRYTCSITSISKSSVQCRVLDTYHEAIADYLPDIAIGVIKNPTRIEWMVEKMVEIGVRSIIPLVTQHCERPKLNMDRLTKIAISAMKQSQKLYLPSITDLTNFSDFVERTKANTDTASKYIASYAVNQKELRAMVPTPHPIILIGPEGDFSNEEIRLANQSGFQSVNMGSSRLRTETAAVVAATLCSIDRHE